MSTSVGILLSVCAAIVLSFSLRASESTPKSFDVPADAAEKAIKLFSQQAGREVLFSTELVHDIRTQPVKGEMLPRVALDQMLSGMGLVAVEDKSGAFSIQKGTSNPKTQGATPLRNDRPENSTETNAPAPKSIAAAVAGETIVLPKVYVTGSRASLESAQEIKQNSVQIVDSIVADDINKLPDTNVAEALQRITGIQMAIDVSGEGGGPNGVALRGLTQVATLVDGREVLVANGTRSMNYQILPAALVAGLDVYKTQQANLVEGGLSGTIDVRLRHPFDFAGSEVDASYRETYGTLMGTAKPSYNLLASDHWKTRFGEIGALVNVSQQIRPWREDAATVRNPIPNTNLVPGQTVTVPDGEYENQSFGYRERIGIDAIVQWRPTPNLDVTLGGNYESFLTHQDTYGMQVGSSKTSLPNSTVLFPGTNDVEAAYFTNAPMTELSAIRDTLDRNRQAYLRAKYTWDNLTLSADASFYTSFDTLLYDGTFLNGTAPIFFFDTQPRVPTTTVIGESLVDPSVWNYLNLQWNARPYHEKMPAGQLDGEYKLRSGFFTSLLAGVRYAAREADNGTGTNIIPVPINLPVTAIPSQFYTNPVPNFFPSEKNPMFRQYLVGALYLARYPMALRQAFNITTPPPAAASPVSLWQIKEDTAATYLMAKFSGKAGLSFDGNVGVRLVRTDESVTGFQTVAAVGPATYVPLALKSSYNDALPSLNLRVKLTEGTYVHLGASKALTRPDFANMSPSLTLSTVSFNSSLNVGSAGNPNLPPMRSDNYDISLEKYFSKTTSVYLAGFYKTASGFPATKSDTETYNGITYQVSRPEAINGAKIKGFEVGEQQFYDFLPGFLSGFGTQLNFTYVDSKTPSSVVGLNTPLPNLSRTSYNAILMYEKHGLSVRVAYNWRDKYLTTITNVVGLGPFPNYNKAYGWLNASATYALTDRIKISVEATNLLNTIRSQYFLRETLKSNIYEDDMELMTGVSIRL